MMKIMILFRLSARSFSVSPIWFFCPVGLLLCAGFFLSAGAYADNKKLKKQIPDRAEPKTSVLIPAGSFTMGSEDGESDEKPVHEVYLDAFRIDSYEVTVADYKTCVDAGKCKTPQAAGGSYNWGVTGREKHPVNDVDWDDASAYCKFAGKRLPTEAEWEKTATWKDGIKYKYPSGKDTVSCEDAVMNDSRGSGCGKGSTEEVGSKPKEINGTYDMAGNVWEWVFDWKGNYPTGQQTNPRGPFSGKYRISRGGGWDYGSTHLRGAHRDLYSPENRYHYLGFRCAVFVK